MKHLVKSKIALAVAAFTIANVADATILATYNVNNVAGNECSSGNAPFGLWTGYSFGSADSCKNFFSIQGGTFTMYDDAGEIKADLDATAINIDGIEATIDFTFSGYEDTYHRTKNGGLEYDPALDLPNWDFFTMIESSVISFSDNYGSYSDFGFVTPDIYGPLVLQFGPGANDKDDSWGASTWLTHPDVQGHWDINITVPEPSSLGLLGLGLIGLGFARRKQAKG